MRDIEIINNDNWLKIAQEANKPITATEGGDETQEGRDQSAIPSAPPFPAYSNRLRIASSSSADIEYQLHKHHMKS